MAGARGSWRSRPHALLSRRVTRVARPAALASTPVAGRAVRDAGGDVEIVPVCLWRQNSPGSQQLWPPQARLSGQQDLLIQVSPDVQHVLPPQHVCPSFSLQQSLPHFLAGRHQVHIGWLLARGAMHFCFGPQH